MPLLAQANTSIPPKKKSVWKAVRRCLCLVCCHCLRGQDTAFALCVATAFAAKTPPLPCVLPLPSRLRHRLCLVCSTAFAAKTLPLPCGPQVTEKFDTPKKPAIINSLEVRPQGKAGEGFLVCKAVPSLL